jgi:hypothetical protein
MQFRRAQAGDIYIKEKFAFFPLFLAQKTLCFESYIGIWERRHSYVGNDWLLRGIIQKEDDVFYFLSHPYDIEDQGKPIRNRKITVKGSLPVIQTWVNNAINKIYS